MGFQLDGGPHCAPDVNTVSLRGYSPTRFWASPRPDTVGEGVGWDCCCWFCAPEQPAVRSSREVAAATTAARLPVRVRNIIDPLSARPRACGGSFADRCDEPVSSRQQLFR